MRWSRDRDEFFIDRRRNLKSNKNSVTKEIFTRYTKRLFHNENAQNDLNIFRSESIRSKRVKEKIKLSNDVIVYENDKKVVVKLYQVISKFNVWKKHDSFVIISSKDHMLINLKSDWANKIKFNKVYFLDSDERAIVDETFDNLHAKKKMKWFRNSTSFEYLVFVIYRTVIKDDKFVRKRRVVIDIRDLNVIIVSNVYSMSMQTNIIVAVAECQFISVVDALKYFYQWTIKFDDRHKLTIISHRDQKQFNVCVMSYKNSSSYVQRQTNLMLKDLRDFVRAYMNDIVIFFKTLNDHLFHLRQVFERLWHYNVVLNSKKAFLNYFSIVFLDQIVDVLDLTTVQEKLAVIVSRSSERTGMISRSMIVWIMKKSSERFSSI
jgi:hypothetical protein